LFFNQIKLPKEPRAGDYIIDRMVLLRLDTAMKNVYYRFVLAGLLPGVAIGWMLHDSAVRSKEDKPNNEKHLALRADRARHHDVRNQRASGLSQKSDQEAGMHRSNTPLLDLVSGSAELAAMTEMSALMSYRLYGEVMNLKRDDFPGVMQRAKVGEKWTGEMLNLLLVRWAEIDPSAALAFGNAHLKGKEIDFDGMDESDWRILITAVDLETNGSGAVTSLEGVLAGEDIEEWWSDHDSDMDLFYLYSVKAAKDPESVWQEILQVAEEESRDPEMLIVGLIDGCQKTGKMSWILDKASHLDEDARDEMLSQIAMIWTMKDPESAVQWAEQLAKDGNRKIAGEVAERWAEKSPKQASEWLLSISTGEGEPNENFKDQAFGYMVVADLDSAVHWLEGQDERKESWDDSRNLLARSLAKNKRYEEAFAWLGQMHDEDQKKQAVASLITQTGNFFGGNKSAEEIGRLAKEYGYGEMYGRYLELVSEQQKASQKSQELRQNMYGKKWMESSE
jgi:pentatricopeptide repeat protein